MSDLVLVRSDRRGLDEMFRAYGTGEAERGRLALDPGWPRDGSRWLFHVRPAELVMEDLTGDQRGVTQTRAAHLLKAETGFRGGDPLPPAPRGSPGRSMPRGERHWGSGAGPRSPS